MEVAKEDKNVCSKEISTILMIEEVSEELTSGMDNPYAATDISKLSPKANPASAPECGGSEFDNNMASLHNHLTAHLSLFSLKDTWMNMKEVAASADREDPTAILSCPLKTVNKDANEELVTEWRLGMGDFPLVSSECGDSSCESSLSERSSMTSSPCTSFTAHSDTRSEDLEGVDIWVSSLDLNEENSDLLQENEQDLGFLSSDFPSPSFSAVRSLQFCTSNLTPAISHTKEANDSDEPIFWPFERTSYDSPEFDKFLLVSPRRNTMDIGFTEIHRLNPIMQRLHKNRLSSARKNVESHHGSVTLGAKGIKYSSGDKVQKANTAPSRLNRTTRTPSKSQSPGNCEKRKPSHLKISPPGKDKHPQLQSGCTVQELEASDLQKLAVENILIEQFIGLNEFDGHEGIDSDSSDNKLSLWLSSR
ncbi:uncharacterized protein LOC102712597 [Oryza brachyantha]|uniref:uncharacterized protein LOC102712597 n=1 Tax=Oryza brachyantha TaxID=4533 RepID=UPI0003EAA234|nr:uncharacterized protein LOC102712597 [Oryza brachyantha]XP_015698563.1 uncharacterized protein LOC102712597 [Oryza brachyantha]